MAHEHFLLIIIARSHTMRRALQRWALRYAARLLRKLGPAHETSAMLLTALGEARASNGTFVGRPVGPRPAVGTIRRPVRITDTISIPRLYTHIDDGEAPR